MNCQEARDMIDRSIGQGGPWSCTRAERSAVYRHTAQCQDCLAWIDAKALAAAKRMALTPREKAVIDGVLTTQINALHAADSQDPEA